MSFGGRHRTGRRRRGEKPARRHDRCAAHISLANRKAVVAAMAKYRVPAMYGVAEMVRSGGLISYGQDLAAQWRMSAVYIDKIVHGTRPADLPVQYATKIFLALNKGASQL